MPAPFTFPQSPFLPLAVGFFGLGTGYFIWGGPALFGFPKLNPESNRTLGMWGIWMPGFMQFITGVYLFVGLTWFGVFTATPALYMAALAFTAYGVHWFAMGWRRVAGSSPTPDGWMAIPFALISILGIEVFASVRDWPVVILFVLLTLIYLSEIPAKFTGLPRWERTVGLWQVLNGCWLMYLTWATAVNLSLHYHWPL